jgi:hypothetical protein
VEGGNGHELIVEGPGVAAGQSAVADHGVGGHADEPGGGPHAGAVGEMPEDRDGLVRGELRAEQGRAPAFGEPIAAGAAIQQPNVLVLAVAGAHRQVAEAPLAVIGAVVILAAETGEILVHGGTSRTERKRRRHRKAIGSQEFTDFNGLETPPRIQSWLVRIEGELLSTGDAIAGIYSKAPEWAKPIIWSFGLSAPVAIVVIGIWTVICL